MASLPEPLQALILAFERLPGIGPKTASRLAFYLLRQPEEISRALAEALLEVKAATALCPQCFNITMAGMERCEVCADSRRDENLLCVVEEPLDVLVLERTGGFNWALPRAARGALADRGGGAGAAQDPRADRAGQAQAAG